MFDQYINKLPSNVRTQAQGIIARACGFSTTRDLESWARTEAQQFTTKELVVDKNSVEGKLREIKIDWADLLLQYITATKDKAKSLANLRQYQATIIQTNKVVEYGYAVRMMIVQGYKHYWQYIELPTKSWVLNNFIDLGTKWVGFLLRSNEDVMQWGDELNYSLDQDYSQEPSFIALRATLRRLLGADDEVNAIDMMQWQEKYSLFLEDYPDFRKIYLWHNRYAASVSRFKSSTMETRKVVLTTIYLIGLINRNAEVLNYIAEVDLNQ